MRLFSVIYVPLSIGATAHIFTSVCGVYMKHKAAKAEHKFLSRKMTLEDFKALNKNGDGVATFDEYVVFMMIATGKVEKGDIARLKSAYDKLDADKDHTLQLQDLMAQSISGSKEIEAGVNA